MKKDSQADAVWEMENEFSVADTNSVMTSQKSLATENTPVRFQKSNSNVAISAKDLSLT
jgi:hypothetical protein